MKSLNLFLGCLLTVLFTSVSASHEGYFYKREEGIFKQAAVVYTCGLPSAGIMVNVQTKEIIEVIPVTIPQKVYTELFGMQYWCFVQPCVDLYNEVLDALQEEGATFPDAVSDFKDRNPLNEEVICV